MKKVKAITDESGHWYVIPNDLVDDFFIKTVKIFL